MTRSEKICISGLVICALVILLILFNKKDSPQNIEIKEPYVEEIKQDSTFRDSISDVNDSIRIKIVYIEKEYEEDTSIIMSGDDSLNLLIFSEYIEYYNNQRAIKNN